VRFRLERDRNRFIACRGVLREILGACFRKELEGIDFDYGCQGKPYLKREDRSAPESLYFNVLHSHGWATYALGISELGVDLDLMQFIPEMQAILDRNFSERIAFHSILWS
jgi:4'-phosphopantetheinyl transferase